MNKNISWKIVLILVLVVLAGLELYPPQKTLKQGLDLAGGSSIIYDIDTQGLDRYAKKDVAANTIKVLRRRIDPGNMMNLEWRVLGSSRIEIKMPLASADIAAKRQAYNNALELLENENVNLAIVRRALDKSSEERNAAFGDFANGSTERMEILANLATAYDARKALQAKRDTLSAAIDTAKVPLEKLSITADSLNEQIYDWQGKDAASLTASIAEYVTEPNQPIDQEKVTAVTAYVDTYQKWYDVVTQLTAEDTGLNVQYTQAFDKLLELNLSSVQIIDVLEMDELSIEREELIAAMLEKYPERDELINNAITAFNEYRVFRGRLDGPEDLKRMLKGAGVLEFRILPRMGEEAVSQAVLNSYVENLKKKGPQAASDSRYIWCEVEAQGEFAAMQTVEQQFGKRSYVLASNQSKETMLANQGGREWKLKKAGPTSDSMGRPAIAFTFDTVAGNLFYRLTSENITRPLCILLDGVALSAPNIQTAISTHGTITGKFNPVEVQDMVSKLNAGSLKARLIEPPVSENTIGPGIGQDNRDKGMLAAFAGLIAVAIFMTVYYVGSGIIAVFALILNLLFVLAIMAFSNATFTLPGIAGIILTIGMSVDANVLIFERIREELEKGSSLKIAIASGYKRAFRTIFDANITTFITAFILYYVASEEIKGFAITLMLGIASSMFTALFVTRVVFQLLTDSGILKNKLPMLKVIRKPAFKWMKIRTAFLAISMFLIVTSLATFYSRDDVKNSKYDIEFTGGTSVTVALKDDIQMTRDQVESLIRQQGELISNPLLERAKVYTVGTSGSEFEISTIETNRANIVITFRDDTKTAETVTADILAACSELGRELDNLDISKAATGQFKVSTSSLNTTILNNVFKQAFGENVNVSGIEVDEIVNTAIKNAFENKLKVLENLNPSIVSVDKIDTDTADKFPEIANYLGGVKIVCKLKKPVLASELQKRLQSLRFKPDLAELTKDPYKLLTTQFEDIEKTDTTISEFIFVSSKADASGAELTAKQFDNFTGIAKKRVLAASALETSLSRVNQIAPSIGRQAKTQALIAIVLSLFAIVGYIWIRFGTARYGFAAIAALVHDVCITLGAVVACTYIAGTPLGAKLGIQDFKISLETIAAFLTIIGYSLNDTIVVFDRIRENKGKSLVLTHNMINDSINQTLSRTILTSFTTFLVVLIMYIYGGAGLRGFTFAMLIGIVVGTYSSIAIAAPILVLGKKKTSGQ